MNAEQLLAASLDAFNQIPNKKLNGEFKDSYAIASAIGKWQKEQDEASYILAYTLCTTFGDDRKPKYEDGFHIFCEYDEMETSPKEQAQQKLNEIIASCDDDDCITEVYTWNIAKITKTSEHYQIR